MKKILGLTVTAIIVMALVGGGTWAYFSDPETSTNNALTAGTLDLTLDGADDPVTMFSIGSVYPGDSGNGTTLLANSGTQGELDISVVAVNNTESTGSTEFESDVIGTGGELGSVAELAIFLDIDDNGNFNSGDIGLKSNQTTYNATSVLDWATADSYSGKTWDAVIASFSTSVDFWVEWRVPIGGSADNTIQGDSISANITFTLEQAAVDS